MDGKREGKEIKEKGKGVGKESEGKTLRKPCWYLLNTVYPSKQNSSSAGRAHPFAILPKQIWGNGTQAQNPLSLPSRENGLFPGKERIKVLPPEILQKGVTDTMHGHPGVTHPPLCLAALTSESRLELSAAGSPRTGERRKLFLQAEHR